MHKIHRFLFMVYVLCIFYNSHVVKADTRNEPKILQPNFIPEDILHRNKELKKDFKNKTPQFDYFVQEITNFVDMPSNIHFYDYINPTIPDETFSSTEFNIYKQILLLKNIEKSPKERDAINGISKFLATNYKTQNIPAYAYINNPQLPEPLYMSQLVYDAFNSVQTGNIDALHALINSYDALLNAKDKFGNELLAIAIMFHRNNMVQFLISKGADINASNNYGETPIIMAARMSNIEAADLLINQGCNLKKLDSFSNSALDYAKESKNIQLYFLLTNGLKKHPR